MAASAGNLLAALDNELDTLLADWTQTLLGNLEDPTVQGNLELLKAEDRQLIQAFLTSRALPHDVDQAFVHAVQESLTGLTKVVVKTEELREALLVGGSPITLDEMKKRFEAYLNQVTQGKDARKLRIVLE